MYLMYPSPIVGYRRVWERPLRGLASRRTSVGLEIPVVEERRRCLRSAVRLCPMNSDVGDSGSLKPSEWELTGSRLLWRTG